jgi:crotonobetainyl-CoA:carnitine CoA-transferase CaiB-like acyl-CoA transferase
MAVAAALTALVHRDAGGPGQHVDVSLHAANNVTTEAASYNWLVARSTVFRQTCRHAAPQWTSSSLGPTTDDRVVHTGVPPRHKREFENLLSWLEDRDMADEYPETFFLRMGVERGGVQAWELGDVECREIYGAGRDALKFLASKSTAQQFFIEGQTHAVPVGLLNAPEDVMADPHFEARGFHVPVRHPELGREFIYPGLPFAGTRAGGGVRRAPLLGQHQADLSSPWAGPARR